jgi:hypothetical protein
MQASYLAACWLLVSFVKGFCPLLARECSTGIALFTKKRSGLLEIANWSTASRS